MSIINCFRNKRVQVILLIILLLAFYIFSFMPVINSDYMYDDILNYSGVRGYTINHDETVWDITVSVSRNWAVNEARPFIFSGYTYLLFQVVNLKQYKVLIILTTFLGALLFGQLIWKCTGRKQLAFLTILLFPATISLDSGYCNSMYGFHMLMQITFIWSMLGMLGYQQYMEKGKKGWQVFSCIFLFIALGTYEVAYVLCALYLFIGWRYRKNFLQVLRSLIPQMLVGAFWLGLRLWLSSRVASHYGGTTISIGRDSITGFLRQLSGSASLISVARAVAEIKEYASLVMDHIVFYGISALLFLLGLWIIKKMFWRQEDIQKLAESRDSMTWWIGIVTIVGPCILIAISQRYQVEVTGGRGYIPAYVSSWGASLCFAIVLEWLTAKKDRFLTILSAMIFLAILIPNQIMGDRSVTDAGHIYGKTDNLFRDAEQLGMFDDWHEGEVILDNENVFIDSENHYSYLLGYPTEVIGVGATYVQDEKGNIQPTERLEYLSGKGSFAVFSITNDSTCLVSVRGNRISVTKQGISVNGTVMKAYIPNGLYHAIESVSNDGEEIRIELADDMIQKKNDRYTLYRLEIPEDLNCLRIQFQ